MPDNYQNKLGDKTQDRSRDRSRVCIIGLDCADPRLVFERFADDLPTLSALRRQGIWGPLRSCNPPITIPAWQVMMTGCDPGQLGVYGFRNRADYSYNNLSLATSRSVKEPRIWDLLNNSIPDPEISDSGTLKSGALACPPSRDGFANLGPSRTSDCYSIVLGVPGTYPPTAIRGDMVSGFLAPDTISNFTHPPELADEIRSVVGEYQIDVQNFRTDDKDRLLEEIISMTGKRFTRFRDLLQTRPSNLAIMVEMGTDRIHHLCWRYFDPQHSQYEPGNPYENVIRDYYMLIDSEVAETLKIIRGEHDQHDQHETNRQNTTVMVVSDHGARALEGGFAFNEWLIREGYLVLKEGARIPKSDSSDTQNEPSSALSKDSDSNNSGQPRIPLEPSMIDWPQTRAWGEGGYYGRLFLNIRDREPQGTVSPDEVESLLNELETRLTTLPDDLGQPMGNVVYKPADIYKEEINGIPPDLMVYFGNLAWRSIGTIETVNDRSIIHPNTPFTPSLYTPENDIGPDDANHDWDGILIAAGGSMQVDENINPQGRYIKNAEILDVAPTVLRIFEQSVPTSMRGNAHISACQ